MKRRTFLNLSLAAGAGALSIHPRLASAQAYPSRPITIIVPFAPGGISDVMARLISGPMRALLNQPVIVENVAGAAGTIGTGRAVRAAADGYTLSIGTPSSHVLAGALYSLQWDLVRDLQPISPLVSEPIMIVGRRTLPAQNLSELIAWLKANPDKASQGTSGVGTVGHVTGALFQQATNTRFQLVPYRGGGPALQDLLAGHTDLETEPSSNFVEQIRAGNLKGYAVAAKARSEAAPAVPTVDEAGLPGFYQVAWVGLWMPKGAPKEIVTKLGATVQVAMTDPNLRARIAELGQQIFPQLTPEALASLQQAEIEKWWPVIKTAGIRGE